MSCWPPALSSFYPSQPLAQAVGPVQLIPEVGEVVVQLVAAQQVMHLGSLPVMGEPVDGEAMDPAQVMGVHRRR